jgi:MFS transporter, SHS family, lactate transporter
VKGDPVGTKRCDYSRVMAIFLACSFVFNILLTILGPEDEGEDVGSDGEGGGVE